VLAIEVADGSEAVEDGIGEMVTLIVGTV